ECGGQRFGHLGKMGQRWCFVQATRPPWAGKNACPTNKWATEWRDRLPNPANTPYCHGPVFPTCTNSPPR
ncbi:MAG TPA: hypothetical protein P5569_13445, partial [Candidatus Latescibacteria bacterium]|nr:hypothetical protein [Candidatus Latescibacterota bacterium]